MLKLCALNQTNKLFVESGELLTFCSINIQFVKIVGQKQNPVIMVVSEIAKTVQSQSKWQNSVADTREREDAEGSGSSAEEPARPGIHT